MVATSGLSSSNWSRGSVRRFPACEGPIYCDHGVVAVVRTSSTTANFGKKFYGCPFYNGKPHSGCPFFYWVEEGMCSHATQIAARAKTKLLEVEAKLNRAEKTYRVIIFLLCLAMIGAYYAGKKSV